MAISNVSGRAKRASQIVPKISSSRGEGLDELRKLYPEHRFYWREPHGLVTFWTRRSALPRALEFWSGFIENLATGEIQKDKVGGTPSMAREMVEDYDVLHVMVT